MQSSDDRVIEIQQRIIAACESDDAKAIIRNLKDLEDIGWKNVCVETRQVGINGERLVFDAFLNGGIRIIAPGTTRAFRLIWLLRLNEMSAKGHYRWLKHKNDMSPEEWDWLHSGI